MVGGAQPPASALKSMSGGRFATPFRRRSFCLDEPEPPQLGSAGYISAGYISAGYISKEWLQS